MRPPQLQIRRLGVQPYAETLAAMRDFTASRRADDDDQIWCLQHPPVFTQGQAGRAEHLLDAGDIPVIVSNRGGQVTYHGPGQLVVYVLLDLQRLGLGIRQLVTRLEQAIVATLAGFAIDAFPRADAPGVYVTAAAAPGGWRKIASLGLRVSRGCSYHGLALNVDMDLAPFLRIDPCGQSGLEMTQIADLGGPSGLDEVADRLLPNLVVRLYRERSTGMDD